MGRRKYNADGTDAGADEADDPSAEAGARAAALAAAGPAGCRGGGGGAPPPPVGGPPAGDLQAAVLGLPRGAPPPPGGCCPAPGVQGGGGPTACGAAGQLPPWLEEMAQNIPRAFRRGLTAAGACASLAAAGLGGGRLPAAGCLPAVGGPMPAPPPGLPPGLPALPGAGSGCGGQGGVLTPELARANPVLAAAVAGGNPLLAMAAVGAGSAPSQPSREEREPEKPGYKAQDPDVAELFDHFHIDPRHLERFNGIMEKRKDSFAGDMIKMWELCEQARSPEGMFVSKMREMEMGTFIGKTVPDSELLVLSKKFGLDREAESKLSDVLAKYEKEKRREYMADLDKHLETSSRPSAMIMMSLKKLGEGLPLGRPGPPAPGCWLEKQKRQEKAGADDRDKERDRDGHRDKERDRGGPRDREGGRDRDRDRDRGRSRDRSRSRSRGRGGR